MFLINSEDGVDWIDRFGGYTNTIKNILIRNPYKIQDVKGFFLGAVSEVFNIRTEWLWQTIRIADRFLDGIKIDRVFVVHHQSDTLYAVAQESNNPGTNPNGDSWHLSNLQIEGEGKRNFIRLSGKNDTMTIDGVINGRILLENGDFELKNIHIEKGSIVIGGASVRICNSVLYFDAGQLTPIEIVNNNLKFKDLELRNVFFTYPFWGDTTFVTKGAYYSAITIDPSFRANIRLENVKQGVQNFNSNQGILISVNGSNSIISMAESQVFSNSCRITRENIIEPFGYGIKLPASGSQFNYTSYDELKTVWSSKPSEEGERGIKWKGQDGTYFYKVGLIYDYDRRIGMYDSRESTVVVTSSDRKVVTFAPLNQFLGNILNTNLIVFRGTSTGVYSDRAIIPMVDNSSQQFDDGISISLRPWTNHTGGAWTFNTYEKIEKNTMTGNVVCYGTSYPTLGTWTSGDRIVNINRVVGQVKSWVYNGTIWLSEGNY